MGSVLVGRSSSENSSPLLLGQNLDGVSPRAAALQASPTRSIGSFSYRLPTFPRSLSICQLAGGASEEESLAHKRIQQKLIAALCLAFVFMIVEVVGGIMAHSLAIITDAAHLLSDVSGFAVAALAAYWAKRRSQQHFSYGYHRVEVLGALASVMTVWLVTGVLLFEAVQRIITPEAVNGKLMFIIATMGVLVNVLMLFILGHHHHGHSHGGGGGHDHGHSHSHIEEGHGNGHACSHDHGVHRGVKAAVKRQLSPVLEVAAPAAELSLSRSSSRAEAGEAGSGGGNNGSGSSCGHKHEHGHSHGHAHKHEQPVAAGAEVVVDLEAGQAAAVAPHSHSHNGHACTHDHSHKEHSHKEHSHKEHSHKGHSHKGHSHQHASDADDEEEEEEDDHHFSGRTPILAAAGHAHHGSSSDHPDHSHGHGGGHDHGSHEPHSHGGGSGPLAAPAGGGGGCSHDHANMNVQGAIIHVIGDFVQSIGVAIAGALIWWHQDDPRWYIADPICTFLFAGLVLWTTRAILRDIGDVLMERVPRGLCISTINDNMTRVAGVEEVHDLHVWSLTPGIPLLCAHVNLSSEADPTAALHELTSYCRSIGIEHSTIQFSMHGAACPCAC